MHLILKSDSLSLQSGLEIVPRLVNLLSSVTSDKCIAPRGSSLFMVRNPLLPPKLFYIAQSHNHAAYFWILPDVCNIELIVLPDTDIVSYRDAEQSHHRSLPVCHLLHTTEYSLTSALPKLKVWLLNTNDGRNTFAGVCSSRVWSRILRRCGHNPRARISFTK